MRYGPLHAMNWREPVVWSGVLFPELRKVHKSSDVKVRIEWESGRAPQVHCNWVPEIDMTSCWSDRVLRTRGYRLVAISTFRIDADPEACLLCRWKGQKHSRFLSDEPGRIPPQSGMAAWWFNERCSVGIQCISLSRYQLAKLRANTDLQCAHATHWDQTWNLLQSSRPIEKTRRVYTRCCYRLSYIEQAGVVVFDVIGSTATDITTPW